MDGIMDVMTQQFGIILAQVSALNWALILSGVGVVEGMKMNARKVGARGSMPWVPMFVGVFVGVVSFMAAANFGGGVIAATGRALLSTITYCGWVTFAYYFTLRPIKYVGDWIKKKSQPAPPKE